MIGRTAFLGALLTGVAAPCYAQEAAPASTVPATTDEFAGEDEILVVGQRERGSVVGDISPEVQLTPADIRSYGVSSVADLIAELAPQTRSERGRTGNTAAVLLNGLRISGLGEIRDIPAEAIQRVDILPEEVGLKYGFTANQKVVNIVLRRRFNAVTAELENGLATDGGVYQPEVDLDVLRIGPDGRFSFSADYERSGALLESERDILAGTGFDQRAFRTLIPSSEQASLNAVFARGLAEGVTGTINGRVQYDDSRSLQGVSGDGAGALITQDNDSLNTRAATTINGAISGWQWTFTGNYDRTETQTTTSVTDDRARSESNLFGGDFTINGQPIDLPAGAVSATVRLNTSSSDFESSSARGVTLRSGDVHRDIGGGFVNLDVPIASQSAGFLGFLGTLSANGNAEVQRLSDFGTLTSYGLGTTWSPIRVLNIVASLTDEEAAPTAQQLGNPVIVTPGLRVFDLVRNQDAIVTQITGGNPGLLSDARRVYKLGMTLKPFGETDLSLTANYTSSRTRNLISSLSFPTADIQAAFPDRFLRDGAGNLIQIDARPVNFAREDREQLRWGINFSKRIQDSTADQFRALAAAGRLPPPVPRPGGAADRGPGGGGQRGPGGFGGGPGGGGGGRLQLALYHTWHFKNEVLVRPGGPLINLLDGGSLGRGGGQPRHEIEAQAGITRNGIGARLSANWQSGTTVRGTSDDLRFGSLGTLDFRLFANLGNIPKLVVDNPWLRGVRATLSVDNVFNVRQRVRGGDGVTPVNYQPDLLDPLGRTVRLSVRKLFFARPQRGGQGTPPPATD